MSNQIYFSGFRVEHFTGWDGVGTPTYSSVSQSSSINSLSMIDCGTVYIDQAPVQGCLWGELSEPISDEIHIMYCVYQDNSGYPSHASIPIMIHGKYTSGDRANVFQILKLGTSNGVYSITEEFFIYSNDISGLPRYSYGSSSDNYKFRIFYISITGLGTITGNVSISYKNEESVEVTQLGTYSVDLSNIIEIESISLHNSLDSQNSTQRYLYCVVSNFDLSGSYLDYAVASSIGYQSGWSGVTTDFSAYPITLSQSDITNNSGVYCVTPNQSVSYTLSKTLNVDSSYTVSAVLLSSPMISSENNQSVSTDTYSPNVIPYIYKKYTNGYSGTYDIEIPNYLASGTGISIVFYMNGTSSEILFNFPNNSTTDPCPKIILNMASTGIATANYITYQQYNNGTYTPIYTDTPKLNQNSWNQLTIFNNNGILDFVINGISYSGTMNQPMIDYDAQFTISSSLLIGGIAYINSNTVPSYPFDKESNVISYIDFSNPSSPDIHGDKTQFNIKDKNISSIAEITNVPDISITSMDLSEMAKVVKTNGGNNMFFLYTNPITNSNWANSDISSLQFGLTKIS